jgi:hypothetical protein
MVSVVRDQTAFSPSLVGCFQRKKNPYLFPLVNVRNKPKGRLSFMYKAPRAFKRFGIPIGLGPADRPQKPTRHHIHTDTGWGPDIQILLFGRIPVLFYISFLLYLHSHSFSLFHAHSVSHHVHFSSWPLAAAWEQLLLALRGHLFWKLQSLKAMSIRFFIHFSIFFLPLFRALLYP